MNDTVRIKRPLNCRRKSDSGGRIMHDSRGNGFLVRTRAGDAEEIPDLTTLTLDPDQDQNSQDPIKALQPYK